MSYWKALSLSRTMRVCIKQTWQVCHCSTAPPCCKCKQGSQGWPGRGGNHRQQLGNPAPDTQGWFPSSSPSLNKQPCAVPLQTSNSSSSVGLLSLLALWGWDLRLYPKTAETSPKKGKFKPMHQTPSGMKANTALRYPTPWSTEQEKREKLFCKI